MQTASYPAQQHSVQPRRTCDSTPAGSLGRRDTPAAAQACSATRNLLIRAHLAAQAARFAS